MEKLDRIAIEAGGNDGWEIDSNVTYVGTSRHAFRDVTVDIDVFQRIDQNGSPSNWRFLLHKTS